jgi:hypothetical protein
MQASRTSSQSRLPSCDGCANAAPPPLAARSSTLPRAAPLLGLLLSGATRASLNCRSLKVL